MAIFKGAGVAMVTPMKDNGEIDYEVLGQLIEDQIAGHTDAIIICGTTGEAPTLEDDEHLEAIRYTVDKTAGRIPVIAGTGSNNTAHAIMMSKEAQKLGADGCLLVAPYYNKATQNGLVRHFAAIAGAVDIPCILYNVPSRTGSNILPETALRLANEVENIVGIKEASGNIGQVGKLAAICEGKLDIYSGNDDQIVPICALGGIGVISVLSNVAPRETHNMVEYCMMNRYDKARQLQHKALDLVNALFCEVNPIPVKAALRMQGFEVGNPRLPLTEMEPEHKEVLRKAMIEFGCL
jgi:4-hydroxy-tetrahydrodipicolinate synthase